MSIVQLSRFLSFFSSDSFDILSNLFSFVKNFFYFSFLSSQLSFGVLQATACIGYHICKALSTTFFQVIFDVLSCPIPGQAFPSFQRFRLLSPALLLPGRSASASPAELIPGGFKFPSSATGAILSLLEGIVNVFSVFYLFQTIRAIQYYQTLLTFHLYLSELYLLPTENQLKKDDLHSPLLVHTDHLFKFLPLFYLDS